MKLLSSESSPFVRKVRLVAALKRLSGDITVQAVDTNAPDVSALTAENPLGKIPVLVLADGTQLYDSTVICEYLDAIRPQPRLIPASGPQRWRTLTLAALADGIMEAALAIVYEKRFRPQDKWVQSWVDRQNGKIDRALDLLETDPPKWVDHPDYGHITLACALGYLDFRHEGRWRASHPKLVGWLDRFSVEVPAFAATKPPA